MSGVVGDWSTASRPIIVSAGAASEGGREKNMAFEVPAAKVIFERKNIYMIFITEALRTGQWGLHEWRLFGGRAGGQSNSF